MKLTIKDFEDAAAIVGCDIPAIKAVARKEGGGVGFLSESGRIILKFEGHKFHEFTHGEFDDEHPTLSYPAWTEKYSHYGELSYDRFNRAFSLDPEAAMRATSWGAFQIMGDNFSSCDFDSVGEFVDYLKKGESYQLKAFCAFVKTQGLAKYLKGFKTNLEVSANAFALRYNGKGYARNNYATDIMNFYKLSLLDVEINNNKPKTV